MRNRRKHVKHLLLALLMPLVSCVTPRDDTPSPLPVGYYLFNAPMFYEDGLAQVSWTNGALFVQLLEHHGGSFKLLVSDDRRVHVRDGKMPLADIKRTFHGSGQIGVGGVVRGEGEIWLQTIGPLKRDHRTGPWTLTPASASESEKRLKRIREREAYRARRAAEKSSL